jgi:phage shock protein C
MTASPGFGSTPYPEPTAPTVAPRRLYRSRTNRTLSGVCGGLAEYYAADPTAVRLLAVLVALITGLVPGIIVYLLAAIVIPERPASDAEVLTPAAHPGQGALVVGLMLVVVGGVALAERLLQVDWEVLWPVALIAIGGMLALVAYRR